jgi:hypothetical protein
MTQGSSCRKFITQGYSDVALKLKCQNFSNGL